MKTTEFGKLGEQLAEAYLNQKGYQTIAKNLHMGHLELDLIVEDDTHLLFIEVKTRNDLGMVSKYGRPGTAVDMKKRRHLLDAANAYLREHPTDKKPRIDVIEVYLCRKGSYAVLSAKGIKHIENALI